MEHVEWPPEIEESIYDLVRPHVRSKLKRRTWETLHEEMLAKVPTHPAHGAHRFVLGVAEIQHLNRTSRFPNPWKYLCPLLCGC